MQLLALLNGLHQEDTVKVRDGKIHFICRKIEMRKILFYFSICIFITDMTNYLSCKVSYH